ncbi:MAG: hypothetical protein HFE66_06545 [Clostridiales bacterium]|jgi:hypothetical protein|nr:hypothetical protein [Clostridiales bacterium]
MLKLAGAALVFIAASLYGRGMCEKMKRRLAIVTALDDLICYIGGSIENFRMPLGRIFDDYHNTVLEETGFLNTLRRDGLAPAISNMEKELPPEIYDQLCSFAGTIGGGSATEETKLCDFTKERLRKVGEDMRTQLPQRLKMYRLLPLLAAASILLLIL